MTSAPGTGRVAYGDDPLQHLVLSRPPGAADGAPGRGTLLLFHGGSWRAGVGSGTLAPLAARLRELGWATADVEYRTLGAGGGWPATFEDAGRAAEHVGRLVTAGLLPAPLVALGHSAGGTLAVWLAATGGGPHRVRLAGAVSLAGVLDLSASADAGLIDGAVVDLLGGTPAQVPDRYRQADPALLLVGGAAPLPRDAARSDAPTGASVRIVHGSADDAVPSQQSRAVAADATAAGQDVRLHLVDTDHMGVIAPDGPAWPAVRAAVEDLRTAG